MSSIIVDNGAATLELAIAGFLVALVVGVSIGLLAGRYRDTAVDLAGRLFGIIIYAFPVFFLGFIAQLVFGSVLGWLPTTGRASPVVEFELDQVTHFYLLDSLLTANWSAFWDVLQHLILPAVTLGLVVSGVLIRLIRVNLLQTMQGDYVEAARARGVSERRVVIHHAFRNALVPVVTVAGLQFAILLGGVVLTEQTFNWPGFGSELIRYLDERDYIAVQGIITIFAVFVVLILAADRPRQRLHRPEGEVLMAGLRRLLRPIGEARGTPRWILFSGLAIVGFFAILAVFAPLIAPYGFDQVSADGVRFPKQSEPSGTNLFGTTVQSTDVLSRVVWGSRTAIEVVVLALVFSLAIGVPLGLLSGYIGGRLDRGLVLVMDALFAFPYLLLAIVIAFLLSDSIGQGVFTAAIAITAVYIPQYFRVVRNHVISVREESYVEAARALGAPGERSSAATCSRT